MSELGVDLSGRVLDLTEDVFEQLVTSARLVLKRGDVLVADRQRHERGRSRQVEIPERLDDRACARRKEKMRGQRKSSLKRVCVCVCV